MIINILSLGKFKVNQNLRVFLNITKKELSSRQF